MAGGGRAGLAPGNAVCGMGPQRLARELEILLADAQRYIASYFDRLVRDGVRAAMILQVHDELLFEADAAAVETAMAVVREEMESVMALRVPLRVDIRAGLSWAEAHC